MVRIFATMGASRRHAAAPLRYAFLIWKVEKLSTYKWTDSRDGMLLSLISRLLPLWWWQNGYHGLTFEKFALLLWVRKITIEKKSCKLEELGLFLGVSALLVVPEWLPWPHIWNVQSFALVSENYVRKKKSLKFEKCELFWRADLSKSEILFGTF